MESRGGAAVEIRGLRAGYGGVEVLRGIDLDLAAGGRLTLLGPNGAGKTTLFRCVLGLLSPKSGTVEIWGQSIRNRPRTGEVAAVLEGVAFPPKVSGQEWLEHHAHLASIPSPRTVVQGMLRGWGIPPLGAVDRLSLGERRKLAVLRALLPSPRLLLLDEPTANLDPVARDEFWSLLDDWNKAHETAVLVTSHQLEDVAARPGDCAVLGGGSIRYCGPAAHLASAFPASRRLRLEREVPESLLNTVVAGLGGHLSMSTFSDGQEFRVRLPQGSVDHPVLVRELERHQIGVELLSEDSTTLREAYRACLGEEIADRAASVLPTLPARMPDSWSGQWGAWCRFHFRGLARDRRLLVPPAALVLVLCGTLYFLPPGFPEDLIGGFAALGALLPTSLSAALAADLVAGERDRRTLEDTLALPWPYSRSLVGSLIAVVLHGLVLSLVSTAAVGLALDHAGSPVPAVSLWAIGLLFGPAALLCCASLGLWISLRARTARSAAQLSTLASLPLLVVAQTLPKIVPGNVAPWAVGAGVLLFLAAALLGWTRKRIAPERLLE